jgi:hypothetical protein
VDVRGECDGDVNVFCMLRYGVCVRVLVLEYGGGVVEGWGRRDIEMLNAKDTMFDTVSIYLQYGLIVVENGIGCPYPKRSK